jgi:hypothetical protein
MDQAVPPDAQSKYRAGPDAAGATRKNETGPVAAGATRNLLRLSTETSGGPGGGPLGVSGLKLASGGAEKTHALLPLPRD